MLKPSIERGLVLLILLGYLIVASLFAVYTPHWQAPDEPAHYNYVAQLVEEGCCPVIEMGDWQQNYQSELTAARFAPELLDELETIQYQDHQPPLYYLIATPAYILFDGSLIAVRMVSVLLGLVVIAGVYAIGRDVFPAQPQLAVAAMALVAFLPQHVAVMSAVTNDALSQAVIVLILLALVRYLKHTGVTAWGLGFWVGIGFLTKTTTYLYAGVVLLAIFLHSLMYRQQKDHPRFEWLLATFAFLAPALVMGSLWWGRNLAVYGFPDFLGLGAHDSVVVGQPRTAQWIAELGAGEFLTRAVQTTFNSFWGQFGWMALPLSQTLYLGIYILMALAISGLVIHLLRVRSDPAQAFIDGKSAIYNANPPDVQRNIWVVMWASLLLAVAAYIYYNTEFVQHQGRYLYPGLIPFALLIVLGLDRWRRVILGRWAASRWLLPLALMGFALLDIWLLFRLIIPWLSPDGVGL